MELKDCTDMTQEVRQAFAAFSSDVETALSAIPQPAPVDFQPLHTQLQGLLDEIKSAHDKIQPKPVVTATGNTYTLSGETLPAYPGAPVAVVSRPTFPAAPLIEDGPSVNPSESPIHI